MIKSDDDVLCMDRKFYTIEALLILTETFQEFQAVTICICNTNESFTNSKSRFEVSVCRRPAISCEGEPLKAFLSFLDLSNAQVDNNRWVPVLGFVPAQMKNGRSV